MYLNRYSIPVVTSTGGADTEYTERAVNGVIHSIAYSISTSDKIESTGTVTITGEETGRSIFSLALSTGAWEYSPALGVTDSTGGAVTNSHIGIPVANERVKVVIAGGGSENAGTFTIYTQGGA
jgi:hypothetical protein